MSRPTTWVSPKDGKRRLIRGTETWLLQWFVGRRGHGHIAQWLNDTKGQCAPGIDIVLSMAIELQRRPECTKFARHQAMKLVPPSCDCGSPGLYIVGVRTFCTACRPIAVAMRQRLTREVIEPVAAAMEKALDHADHNLRIHEQHHAAMGRKHPRRR